MEDNLKQLEQELIDYQKKALSLLSSIKEELSDSNSDYKVHQMAVNLDDHVDFVCRRINEIDEIYKPTTSRSRRYAIDLVESSIQNLKEAKPKTLLADVSVVQDKIQSLDQYLENPDLGNLRFSVLQRLKELEDELKSEGTFSAIKDRYNVVLGTLIEIKEKI